MPDLPSGTVTFVFSDLEGSTRLLKQLGDETFAQLLATHRALLREVFARHGGNEIDTQGDAFFYSFSRARSAVAAAVELQRAHAEQAWPGGVTLNVRLGLHTGEPVVGDEGYTGLDVVRAARIAADGKGGQILLSEATRAIVGGNLPDGVGIRELGERTLKDIDQPEPLFELVYASEVVPTASAEPVESAEPGESAKPGESVRFDVDAGSLVKEWRELAHSAIRDSAHGDFDPGPAIEQRVLAQLRKTFGNAIPSAPSRPKLPSRPALPGLPPAPGKPGKPAASKAESFAQQIERLDARRDEGVLSDEQYSKAVDRLLAEG